MVISRMGELIGPLLKYGRPQITDDGEYGPVTLYRAERFYDRSKSGAVPYASPVYMRETASFWTTSRIVAETYAMYGSGFVHRADFTINQYIYIPDRHGIEFRLLLARLSEILVGLERAMPLLDRDELEFATDPQNFNTLKGRHSWPTDQYVRIIAGLQSHDVWPNGFIYTVLGSSMPDYHHTMGAPEVIVHSRRLMSSYFEIKEEQKKAEESQGEWGAEPGTGWIAIGHTESPTVSPDWNAE